jgi:hypothetical protein
MHGVVWDKWAKKTYTLVLSVLRLKSKMVKP